MLAGGLKDGGGPGHRGSVPFLAKAYCVHRPVDSGASGVWIGAGRRLEQGSDDEFSPHGRRPDLRHHRGLSPPPRASVVQDESGVPVRPRPVRGPRRSERTALVGGPSPTPSQACRRGAGPALAANELLLESHGMAVLSTLRECPEGSGGRSRSVLGA